MISDEKFIPKFHQAIENNQRVKYMELHTANLNIVLSLIYRDRMRR